MDLACGLAACAHRALTRWRDVIERRFGQDRMAGIAGAEEENVHGLQGSRKKSASFTLDNTCTFQRIWK